MKLFFLMRCIGSRFQAICAVAGSNLCVFWKKIQIMRWVLVVFDHQQGREEGGKNISWSVKHSIKWENKKAQAQAILLFRVDVRSRLPWEMKVESKIPESSLHCHNAEIGDSHQWKSELAYWGKSRFYCGMKKRILQTKKLRRVLGTGTSHTLWFNPRRQLSTTQLLAHPSLSGWGRESEG